MPYSSRSFNAAVNILVTVAGIIFVFAGAFKLFFARTEFAIFLAALQVPFARGAAFAVPAIEICGGAALCWRRGMRLWAALLAMDMAVAIVTVGLPGLHGHSHRIGTHNVGNEPWRLPLELGLLALMLSVVCCRRGIAVAPG